MKRLIILFVVLLTLSITTEVFAEEYKEVKGSDFKGEYKENPNQETLIHHHYPDGKYVIEGNKQAIESHKKDIAYVMPDGTSVGFVDGRTGEPMTYTEYMKSIQNTPEFGQHSQDIINKMGSAPSGYQHISRNPVATIDRPVTAGGINTQGARVISGFTDDWRVKSDVKKEELKPTTQEKVIDQKEEKKEKSEEITYELPKILISK